MKMIKKDSERMMKTVGGLIDLCSEMDCADCPFALDGYCMIHTPYSWDRLYGDMDIISMMIREARKTKSSGGKAEYRKRQDEGNNYGSN